MAFVNRGRESEFSLKIDDFEEFFLALNGVKPFPWQSRLLRQIVTGKWPELIDLPTSSGKTAILDIALFHLALEAEKPPSDRSSRVRIFFVVDRRVVVDEAFLRAQRIAKKLMEALKEKKGIVHEVATKLAAIAGNHNSEPLMVIRLRGGLPRERTFITNPAQPSVIVSTIDQVGSRLLFKGYGVSKSMNPIHAALIGVDSLIILDEAHISQPFSDTLNWINHYQSDKWRDKLVSKPIKIVRMSATYSSALEGESFHLEPDDLSNETLSKRLICSKMTKFVSVNGDSTKTEETKTHLSKSIVKEARSLMELLQSRTQEPCVVGIVANTVATARMAFKELGDDKTVDSVLLIGRIRAYDRDKLVDEYLPRIRANRTEEDNQKSLFVVATQTIEVGADIDFDGLVTEIAPLDVLQQRFGRLDRLGRLSQSNAVIITVNYEKTDIIDPIYGEALTKTSKWLEKTIKKIRNSRERAIDLGVMSLKKILPDQDELKSLVAPVSLSPILMPSHLDMLVQTNPPADVQPEISFYLHGLDSQPEDVQLVWRSDLPRNITSEKEDDIIRAVAILPPSQGETLSVPIWHARGIFSDSYQGEMTDQEGVGTQTNVRGSKINSGRYAVRWLGADDSIVIYDPREIAPGDTLVIPAAYGGTDRYGWNPKEVPTEDVSDFAAQKYRGMLVLRLNGNLIANWLNDDLPEDSLPDLKVTLKKIVSDAIKDFKEDLEPSTICNNAAERILEIDGIRNEVRTVLEQGVEGYVYPSPEDVWGFILFAKPRVSAVEFTDEDDSSSLGSKVTLEEHSRQVGNLAKQFSELAGISSDLVSIVSMAGRLHDIGKADPRFQAWLRGGEWFSEPDEEHLLAKSDAFRLGDWNGVNRARIESGYPKGARHECYSAAIVARNLIALKNISDPELLLYLIGTHHGRGRPFMPAITDGGVSAITLKFDYMEFCFEGNHNLDLLNSAWPEKFWSLNRKYGYWGLAYLETLVRLADHKCSSGHGV